MKKKKKFIIKFLIITFDLCNKQKLIKLFFLYIF
jgi:hypothetical protein